MLFFHHAAYTIGKSATMRPAFCQGVKKWYSEKSTVFTSGAHAPKREILGSRYPRKYSSSTTGPAIALTTNPKAHVISNAAVEYWAKSSVRKNDSGTHRNTFSMK